MDWKSIVMQGVNKLAAGVASALIAYGLIAADGSQTQAVIGAVGLAANIVWDAWMKWGMVLISTNLAKLKGIPLPDERPSAKMSLGGSAVAVKSSVAF